MFVKSLISGRIAGAAAFALAVCLGGGLPAARQRTTVTAWLDQYLGGQFDAVLTAVQEDDLLPDRRGAEKRRPGVDGRWRRRRTRSPRARGAHYSVKGQCDLSALVFSSVRPGARRPAAAVLSGQRVRRADLSRAVVDLLGENPAG